MKNLIYGFFMAWGNFSVIPCPCKIWKEEGKKWMLSLMSLIGLIIGLINYGVYTLMVVINKTEVFIPLLISATILMILPHFMTGFIHLDGFMDCADAILSRRDTQTRVKILKDSRVGAFSVISIIFLFLLNFSGVVTILSKPNSRLGMILLIFIYVISRSLASADVLRLKPLEVSQYAISNTNQNNIKELTVNRIILVISIGLSLFFGILYNTSLVRIGVIILGTILAQVICRMRAVKSLGGINGDIAGYSIVMSEVIGICLVGILV